MGIASGRVVQVNVSPGGVPKLPVGRAWVGTLGLDGDKHSEPTVHGGPHRAVCLYGMEVIERLQAEGHPIGPGSAGENLTTRGIEWSLMPVGATIHVGDELVLQLASPTTPCVTQKGNFSDGNFNRILIDQHPSDSRMYARVVREGYIAPGDAVTVEAPADSTATDVLTLRRLDRAEGKSSVAAWKAARAAGFEIDHVEDGEVAMSSSRQLPGPVFNQAHGFAGLPNMLSMATSYYDLHDTRGWIWAAEPLWKNAQCDLTLDIFGASPGDIADIPAPPGVVIRRLLRDESADLANVKSGSPSAGGMEPGAIDPWPKVMMELAKTHSRQIFVAEIGGEVVGHASLHVSGGTGWMRGATVSAEAQGRGIQRALIAARARAAQDASCDLVGASAEPGFVSAVNLERSGMRRFGTRFLYVYQPGQQTP